MWEVCEKAGKALVVELSNSLEMWNQLQCHIYRCIPLASEHDGDLHDGAERRINYLVDVIVWS